MPTESKSQSSKKRATEEQRKEIREEILEELLSDYEKPEDLLGENGIFDELKKRLLERVLDGELTDHLGYRRHEERPEGQSNARNGRSSKRVKTLDGELEISQPATAKAVLSRPLSRRGPAASAVSTKPSSTSTPPG